MNADEHPVLKNQGPARIDDEQEHPVPFQKETLILSGEIPHGGGGGGTKSGKGGTWQEGELEEKASGRTLETRVTIEHFLK